MAPAGTPRAIIDKIQREVVAMYADPIIAEKLANAGITTATSTPEEMAALMAADYAKYGTVVKSLNLKE